jgi:hypothetical protein
VKLGHNIRDVLGIMVIELWNEGGDSRFTIYLQTHGEAALTCREFRATKEGGMYRLCREVGFQIHCR